MLLWFSLPLVKKLFPPRYWDSPVSSDSILSLCVRRSQEEDEGSKGRVDWVVQLKDIEKGKMTGNSEEAHNTLNAFTETQLHSQQSSKTAAETSWQKAQLF